MKCKLSTINGWCGIFNKSCKECISPKCEFIKKAYRQGRVEAEYFGYHKREWIPVSERLPEVGDIYIVSGRMKYDFEKEYTYFTDCAEYLPIGSTDGTEWETWTDWYEGQQEYEILAWRPQPKPYKAESEVEK